jgi:hypothetical protein
MQRDDGRLQAALGVLMRTALITSGAQRDRWWGASGDGRTSGVPGW